MTTVAAGERLCLAFPFTLVLVLGGCDEEVDAGFKEEPACDDDPGCDANVGFDDTAGWGQGLHLRQSECVRLWMGDTGSGGACILGNVLVCGVVRFGG